MQSKLVLSSLLSLGLCLGACAPSPSTPSPSTPNSATSENNTPDSQAFIAHYGDLVLASYQDALSSAQNLQTQIDAFVSAPSSEGLEAAKTAWLEARKPYGQTEGFRFYDGPIDREGGPEGALNAWPLDEVYIDAVAGQPEAGIINNPEIEISVDQLRALNEVGGDKNISTGYHAIEFLLWGQDLSEGPGAGQRPFTDYTTANNAARRGQYLKLVTEMLISDLQSMVQAWSPGQQNYRSEFEALPADEALAKVLRGIGTLSASELASERMATPLDIGDREEEHSCFSDNTHNDILYNAMSIHNVLSGKYERLDGSVLEGPGFIALLATQDADKSAELQRISDATLELARAIQAPFDQEIRPSNDAGNARVLALVKELQTQGKMIVEAGAQLGLTINTDL